MDDAEVDELHRIIAEHEDIARFYIAMNQSLVVSGLQTSGSLSDDVYDSVGRESRGVAPDDFVEREARQQRHHKERLLASFVIRNAEIQDIDDVGMAQPRENSAFPPKQLYLLGIQYFFDGFEGYVTLHFKINRAVDNSHAPFTDDLFDLVTLVRGHTCSPRDTVSSGASCEH